MVRDWAMRSWQGWQGTRGQPELLGRRWRNTPFPSWSPATGWWGVRGEGAEGMLGTTVEGKERPPRNGFSSTRERWYRQLCRPAAPRSNQRLTSSSVIFVFVSYCVAFMLVTWQVHVCLYWSWVYTIHSCSALFSCSSYSCTRWTLNTHSYYYPCSNCFSFLFLNTTIWHLLVEKLEKNQVYLHVHVYTLAIKLSAWKT